MSRQKAHLRPLVCLAVAMMSLRLDAAVWSLATSSGVMQQPTSHYYHFCYGLQLGVATDSERVGIQLQYIERPTFIASGFSDQESAVIGMITSKLTRSKFHGLYGGFGVGQLVGFVKANDPAAFDNSERSYAVRGVAAMAEYAVQLSNVEIAANHQTLVGYVNDDQLKSFVAWPYNFYALRIGYRW